MLNHREIHLLIADDDQDDFELFQDALAELSFEVSTQYCRNGVELMHLLKLTDNNHQPDVIFLDLNMPQKTGFECIREIRTSDNLKNVPVVIFSTSSEMEIVRQLRKDGADRYLVKPNNFKDLKKIIGQVLQLITETKLQNAAVDDFVLQP